MHMEKNRRVQSLVLKKIGKEESGSSLTSDQAGKMCWVKKVLKYEKLLQTTLHTVGTISDCWNVRAEN